MGIKSAGFSVHPGNAALSYVEKALAVYQKGYHHMKQSPKGIQKAFQLLNKDQLDVYPLQAGTLETLRFGYMDLLVNFF